MGTYSVAVQTVPQAPAGVIDPRPHVYIEIERSRSCFRKWERLSYVFSSKTKVCGSKAEPLAPVATSETPLA